MDGEKGFEMGRREILLGFVVAVFMAVLISPFASRLPDGLERVAQDKGFLHKAVCGSGVELFGFFKNEKVATVLAGVVGVVIVFVFGCTVACILLRRKSQSSKTRG